MNSFILDKPMSKDQNSLISLLFVAFLVCIILYWLYSIKNPTIYDQDPYASATSTTTTECPVCPVASCLPQYKVPASNMIQTASPRLIITSQGAFTGNPVTDTPVVFQANDVIGLYSVSAKKYLEMIDLSKQTLIPNPTSITTPDYNVAIQVSADSCIDNPNAQWIVHISPTFANGIRLENVAKRGLLLKGFYFTDPGHKNTFGFQPGLPTELLTCMYSTLATYVENDPSLDKRDVFVLYPASAGQHYKVIDDTASIFLTANDNGTLGDAGLPHTPEQIQWQRVFVGRMTFDNQLVVPENVK